MNATPQSAYFKLLVPECFGIAERVFESGKPERINAALELAGREAKVARSMAWNAERRLTILRWAARPFFLAAAMLLIFGLLALACASIGIGMVLHLRGIRWRSERKMHQDLARIYDELSEYICMSSAPEPV